MAVAGGISARLPRHRLGLAAAVADAAATDFELKDDAVDACITGLLQKAMLRPPLGTLLQA